MVAFLFTGWLTFGLAAIVGYHKFIDDCRTLKIRVSKSRAPNDVDLQAQSEPSTLTQAAPAASMQPAVERPGPSIGLPHESTGEIARRSPEENDSRWTKVAKGILAPLCDLQAATGTAILIAGLAQGSNLTYYHELIVASYWNITLNSFWAAQISNPKYCDMKDLPSRVRNSTVLCSSILSVYFQAREVKHEYWSGYWDPFTP